MDEKLQAELLNILRSLQENANPAFEILVKQRQDYAWIQVYTFLVLGIICAITAIISISKLKVCKSNEDVIFVYGVLAILSAAATIPALIASSSWLAVAMAPLGSILGIIR